MEYKENPGRLAYINEITDQLTRLGMWVESANKSKRTDLAIISEDIVGGLLNRMFREDGWNLVPSNTPKCPNFPGIDLADEELCIGVQVTSQNTLDKVKDMLEKFSSHQLDQWFDRLILVILTSQDPKDGMKKRCTDQFDGKKDIWNIPYLLRIIQSIPDVDRLEEITVYLQKQVGDLYRKLQNPPVENPESEPQVESQADQEEITDTPEQASNAPSLLDSIISWFIEDENETTSKSSFFSECAAVIMGAIFMLCVIGFIISLFPISEMPDELSGYNVTINSASVSVPTTFEQMESLGWLASDPDLLEEWIEPGGGRDSWSYISLDQGIYRTELTNGHGSIDVLYMNPTAHTLQVRDCIIYSLDIKNGSFDNSYTGESVNVLETPLGLRMGQSKWSERTEYPSGHDKDKDRYIITYSYVLENNNAYIFSFDKESKLLSGVEIRNLEPEAMEKLSGVKFDTEAPAYDPGKLEDWVDISMNIHIDGFDFPVLCTVQAYSELNYTLDKAPEYVTSTEHSDIYFRGDALHLLSGQVYNPFPRALTPENCFISCIDTHYIEPRNKPFVFTCSIADQSLSIPEGMTKDELITALNDAGIQWIESSVDGITFYPNSRLETMSVLCFLNDEGLVSNLKVDACQALQDYFFSIAP